MNANIGTQYTRIALHTFTDAELQSVVLTGTETDALHARSELIGRYTKCIFAAGKSFFGIDEADLLSAGLQKLDDIIPKWDPAKGAFGALAKSAVGNMCKSFLRKRRGDFEKVNADITAGENGRISLATQSAEDAYVAQELTTAVADVLDALTDEELTVAEARLMGVNAGVNRNGTVKLTSRAALAKRLGYANPSSVAHVEARIERSLSAALSKVAANA